MGVERDSDRTVWVIVGLIAIVAMVALVYLFSQSNRADLSRHGDAAAIGKSVEAAGEKVETAAEKAGAAAERAADRAGNAIENAGDKADAERTAPPPAEQKH
ncbi:hypothetical protein [Caulobacter sp. 17J65-9]|uniref:hypothetical protein n=1 Tax=Caulobacter sp. 17J65-9 TaxID=2709382 RepID=UPI0013C66F9A|nr:hypothetical protein [Caulobacter sp. 17J65-9]NEX93031.1 hypothetical protein [Caulobacter sp. 17J65-9]